MAYDFRIDTATNDLATDGDLIIEGNDEVLQRIRTRLRREYGEWFLNTECGLPWYGENGNGILGSKTIKRSEVLLLIRGVIQDTDGVKSITKLSSTYSNGDRAFDIYCEIVLNDNATETLKMSFGTNQEQGE